ncbi:MAG: hypothetical protein U1E60_00340 [Reyranellaceae bacterium]
MTAPTSVDDVIFDNNTGSVETPIVVTVSAEVDCKSIFFGGPTVRLDFLGTYSISVAGDITLFRLEIVNPAATGAFVITGNCTLTSNGYDASGVVVTGGITTLADDLLCTTVLACASAGTLDTAGYAVTADRFSSAGSGASTYLKGSMVTITGAGTAWDFSAGALSAGTSTIKFTNVSAAGRTFAGGGKSYHDVWFSGGYAGILQIAGSNSFNDFRSDAGLHTIQFPVGGTQTVGSFTVGGSGPAARTTLRTELDGFGWNLVCAGGAIACEWLVLKDSHASGGASFAASNSLDGGGNSGWTIVAPAVPLTSNRRVRLTYMRR